MRFLPFVAALALFQPSRDETVTDPRDEGGAGIAELAATFNRAASLLKS